MRKRWLFAVALIVAGADAAGAAPTDPQAASEEQPATSGQTGAANTDGSSDAEEQEAKKKAEGESEDDEANRQQQPPQAQQAPAPGQTSVPQEQPANVGQEALPASDAPISAGPASSEAPSSDREGSSPAGFDKVEDTADDESTATVTTTITRDLDVQGAQRFGATVILEHSFGSGNFIENDYLRGYHDYVGQIWDFRPYVRFNIGDHKLKAELRWSFETQLTTPQQEPDRRWTPYDMRLQIIDPALYKESFTGITFRGSLAYFLPTSYESVNVKRQWSALRAGLGAQRSFGPIYLTYGITGTKYFNGSRVRMSRSDISRPSDRAASPTRRGDPYLIAAGAANIEWAMSNDFSISYQITEELAVSYSLSILNYFNYELYDERDQFTAPLADPGRGRSDMLWPTFEVSYGLTDILKSMADVPFSLSAAVGISALHPAQTADNQGIMWPVFYQAFAQNRAANNYGSVYIDLIGTY